MAKATHKILSVNEVDIIMVNLVPLIPGVHKINAILKKQEDLMDSMTTTQTPNSHENKIRKIIKPDEI